MSLEDVQNKIRRATAALSGKLKNQHEAIGAMSDFKEVARRTKNYVEGDYERIEAYYSGDIDFIFKDWKNQSWFKAWMSFKHVNKTKEAIDSILSNVIPAWPRPTIVATQAEHKPLADAGDALLESTLRRGGYQISQINLVTLMGKFNTAFMSPSLDKLSHYPEKRITFEVDHPFNVLMTPGARNTQKAAQILVTRRIHKETLKGIFPSKKDDIERLKGPDTRTRSANRQGPKETIREGAFFRQLHDDPNNVTLELFYQRDWSRVARNEDEDFDKITREDVSYIRANTTEGMTPPPDEFDILDFHEHHLEIHMERFKTLTAPGVDGQSSVRNREALAAYSIHIAKHQNALAQDIVGGEELKFPFGKRFTLIVGEKEVFYDGPDPHSEFGITDFPIVDFQLVHDTQNYWNVALGRAVIELNASRNRLTNAQELNTILHGMAKMVVPADSGYDIHQNDNSPFQEIVEDIKNQKTTRYLQAPTMGPDVNIAIQRIDQDIQRITGLFATFKGELPQKLSGEAIKQLNVQSAKTIDVKIDSQRDAISRFGEMVFKMSLAVVGSEDKALIVGEGGFTQVQELDIEGLKDLDYQIVAVPGPKAGTPLDQKQQAFQNYIAQMGPILSATPGGIALLNKLAMEIFKGAVPEIEKFQSDIEAVLAQFQPEQGQGELPEGVLPMQRQGGG